MEGERWRDIVFINLEPSKWIGIELFFTPVEATKQDWKLQDTEKSWAQFSRFYPRTRNQADGEEPLKIYVREEFFGVTEVGSDKERRKAGAKRHQPIANHYN